MQLVTIMMIPLVLAAEGKWTPQQVLQQGPAWVKQQGFGLPLKQLWNEKTSTGLLANAVQLPGCSGSFVSKEGLLITNHHCVVGILQEHSSSESNLVKDGYVARSRADEKPAKAYRIQVPVHFTDVTQRVLESMKPEMTGLERYRAVERTSKQLVAACEAKPATRCTFAIFDGGVFFSLTEFAELTDVRLVYAPPTAIGDFGGEIDNWMWPRHAGDFALLRAYRDGKPFTPAVHFPVSTAGVKEGEAVAVLGYPGTSFRSWLADEMRERQERWFPAVRRQSSEWIQIMEDEGRKVPAAAIATADDLRGLKNVKKNADGQLMGLRRGRIVELQKEREARVRSWAATRPESAGALAAYAELLQLAKEREQTWDRDFLLDQSGRGARALSWPLLVVRRSVEAQRPDAQREIGYQERDLSRLRDRHERDQKRLAASVDRRLLASWVKRALALPGQQRLSIVDRTFGSAADDGVIAQKTEALIAGSKVYDLDERRKMIEETPAQLAARADPLLDFALALDAERRALRDRRDEWSGRLLQLKPVWRHAVMAAHGKPVAPDANSTLRVSFGRVKGYSPQEAMAASPRTTLKGLMAKRSDEEPFLVPSKVNEVYAKGGAEQVPVDFLADCDTTGGNSGSPVIDGRGRLVGVNFDRVWENVANDFGYNPEVARNVVADVRYLLWLLRSVENAPTLVDELTAH